VEHARGPAIVLGGPLTVEQFVSFGRGETSGPVVVSEQIPQRVRAAHERFESARRSRPTYGANTGVGANLIVAVSDADQARVGQRLLRSHAAGVGPVLDAVVSRAAMLVRLNQLAQAGSGISLACFTGLLDAVNGGAEPELHSYGSIGTADIAQLAELALTLTGERPWTRNPIAPVAFDESDALPFISSSAITLANAAIGVVDAAGVLAAAETVAAMSFVALNGSIEASDPLVHGAGRHPEQAGVAARLRRAVSADGPRPAAAVQDPFSLRTIPLVHGPAVEALLRAAAAIERDSNAASENPLVVGADVRHHGLFLLSYVASALDQLRTSVLSVLTLSAARLGHLFDPQRNGSTAFLADASPGSSGLLICEYLVQDALATARVCCSPSAAPVSISLGVEDFASFAAQSARQLRSLIEAAELITAIEALAATRALRLAPERRVLAPVNRSLELVSASTSGDLADRPIADDVATVIKLLPELATVALLRSDDARPSAGQA
jgi:histidine ammonia-lyase